MDVDDSAAQHGSGADAALDITPVSSSTTGAPSSSLAQSTIAVGVGVGVAGVAVIALAVAVHRARTRRDACPVTLVELTEVRVRRSGRQGGSANRMRVLDAGVLVDTAVNAVQS